jgi:hypothetical protein
VPGFSDARWTGHHKHTARKLRCHWARVNHPAEVSGRRKQPNSGQKAISNLADPTLNPSGELRARTHRRQSPSQFRKVTSCNLNASRLA